MNSTVGRFISISLGAQRFLSNGVTCAVVSSTVFSRTYYKKTPQFSYEMESTDRKSGKKKERGPTGGKKNQNLLRAPTTVNIVVVGTGGPGTSRSLLVTTEYSRYLFNCGEGTQRMGSVSKNMQVSAYAKIAGLEQIFITHNSWENTGGLLGLAMQLEGQKNPESKFYLTRDQRNNSFVPKISLYGPPGVEKITLMARKFSEQMNLQVVREEGEFNDSAVHITPIVLNAQASNEDAEGEPSAKRQCQDPLPSSAQEAYCYICKVKPVAPKINIEKCYEAGVKIGPMVGQLQKGYSVTLEDGRVVHPHQVTDQPNQDKRLFLIMDCPQETFLPSLASNPQLAEYMNQEDPTATFGLIVHMTPAEIYNSEQYQTWMKGFHSTTNHLVLNRNASEVDHPRAREHQAMLNLVSPDVFPSLSKMSVKAQGILDDKTDADETDDNTTSADIEFSGSDTEPKAGKVVVASPGLYYTHRGKRLGFHMSQDDINVDAIKELVLSEETTKLELEKLHKELGKEEDMNMDDEENPTKYPRVTFLGTGSSEPNRIRCQSCILVQLSKHTAIILDCGEDSYGQLYRFYGAAKAKRILKKVKAIFVSHLHADHHLGLFTLLKERRKLFDEDGISAEPVILMAPIQIRRWLRFYHEEIEPVDHLFRFLKLQKEVGITDKLSFKNVTAKKAMAELNLAEYEPVEVIHCANSFGIVFTHVNGFKLVYSGDTRPCDALIKAGENCDLLIHEATHEDALIKQAQISKHTTFSEAMEVGAKMKAKHVILTHFSQRYAKMVPLSDLNVPENVGIAFDNMQVVPSTFKHLNKMIPALSSIFAEELQKMEIKTNKRTKTEDS